MNDEIKEMNLSEMLFNRDEQLLDYITKLQQENERLKEQVNQYENPDDMTLFYMWLDVKAKDKIKELQQENERLKHQLKVQEDLTIKNRMRKHIYKSCCEKASEYIGCHFKDMVADEEAQVVLNIL